MDLFLVFDVSLMIIISISISIIIKRPKKTALIVVMFEGYLAAPV